MGLLLDGSHAKYDFDILSLLPLILMKLNTILHSNSFSLWWITSGYFLFVLVLSCLFSDHPFFISFLFFIWYFNAESQLILIKQLLESLLTYKSNYSNEILYKSYEILFFIKWQKIYTFKKGFKTFTNFYPDTRIYFLEIFIKKIRKIYPGYPRLYFWRNIYVHD